MHASVNMGCQGKSGPGKIHEVILVLVNEIKAFDSFECSFPSKILETFGRAMC